MPAHGAQPRAARTAEMILRVEIQHPVCCDCIKGLILRPIRKDADRFLSLNARCFIYSTSAPLASVTEICGAIAKILKRSCSGKFMGGFRHKKSAKQPSSRCSQRAA